MSRALLRLETPEYGLPFERSPEAVRRKSLGRFEQGLARCESNITESGEKEIIRHMRLSWDRLRPALEASPAGSWPADSEEIQSFRELHEQIESLVAVNEEGLITTEQETRRVARVMRGAMTLSALSALAALALFAIVSANRIANPVTEVSDRLHRALNPDPGSGPVPDRRGVDEIARLRSELEDLQERLRLHEDEQNRQLSHLQTRLAFVMNKVLEGMVLLDADLHIVSANRIGRTILRLAGDAGGALGDLDLSDDVRRVLAPVMDGAFQPERDLGEFGYRVGDEERVYRPRVLTVPRLDGGVEGYLLLFWDVTEQRRFEASRRRFISMLSHQLKTPMTSLSMSVNLLREKLSGTGDDRDELLSIASEACHNLSTLVSDLIEASRDMTPDLSLKPRRVDLVRLLNAALRPLVPQAEEKGIDFRLPAPDQTAYADVDPVKFPWVVINIAGNALRYTPRGGRIEVDVRAAANGLEVAVSDTGAGIEPENLESIFQPYVSTDREPEPGTHGLGLAIAREIVEAHGGGIEAGGEPGRGASFQIRLPANPERKP